jgi:hypothetical protein
MVTVTVAAGGQVLAAGATGRAGWTGATRVEETIGATGFVGTPVGATYVDVQVET